MSEDWPSSREQLLKDIETFAVNGPPPVAEPVRPAPTSTTSTAPAPAAPATAAPAAVAPQPSRPATPAADTAFPMTESSLLSNLKQQAEAKKAGDSQQSTLQNAQLKQISEALQRTFLYLNELAPQLNVLKPAYEKSYSFFGAAEFDGMNWEEGRADFRMQQVASEDRYYEQVTLRYRLQAPKQFRITRDNPALEKLRKALFDHGIVFKVDEETNDRGRVERATFTFPCEIKAGLLLLGDQTRGDLVLRTRNIERFGTMEFRCAPAAVTTEALDELALLILGKPNRISQHFQRTL